VRLRRGYATATHFYAYSYAVQKSVIERWSFVKDATGSCGGIDCHEIRKRWPSRLVATAADDRLNFWRRNSHTLFGQQWPMARMRRIQRM